MTPEQQKLIEDLLLEVRILKATIPQVLRHKEFRDYTETKRKLLYGFDERDLRFRTKNG